MEKDIESKISMIAEAVTGLKYHEWLRINQAVEKKFSSAASKVELEDTEELERAIKIEF